MLNCHTVRFLLSVHSLSQLPEASVPEIAFAGRSNVGKSSLLNALMGRKDYVKVSSKPGKTQGLNFFSLDECAHFVDLPGYGYAKVPKGMQDSWQRLITSYLERRTTLCCVVVIVDIRHEAKLQDRQLLDWLRQQGRHLMLVYTKADKLSGNERVRCATLLDAGFGVSPASRVIVSSRTGMGISEVKEQLGKLVEQHAALITTAQVDLASSDHV